MSKFRVVDGDEQRFVAMVLQECRRTGPRGSDYEVVAVTQEIHMRDGVVVLAGQNERGNSTAFWIKNGKLLDA